MGQRADGAASCLGDELMGWRAGARVRLATVRASISLDAGVVVEPSGQVWLSPGAVEVIVADTTPGLLSPPDDETTGEYLDALVRHALVEAPVWVIPSLPSGVTPAVELQGGYLVIRDT